MLTLRCACCGVRWEETSERDGSHWQVFFTCGQPPQPVVYCPHCAIAPTPPRRA